MLSATSADIAICIPARNEAERLPALFAALDRLVVPTGRSVAVCLLLDGCGDASRAVVASWRSVTRHHVVVAFADPAPPNAGRARDRAMRIGIDSGAAILCTTDADSLPAADWLIAMLSALDHGDIVTGDVVRPGRDGHRAQDRIERHYATLHHLRRRIDPVAWDAADGHPHASGANMALSANLYHTLGGFLPLARGEDARLIDDAARAGYRVRRDAASIVHTSDRRVGRARGGLATMLCDLDRDGLAGVTVAHPADQLWQYRMQALARACFANDPAPLAEAIGLSVDHLRGVARDCPNAEAFAMRVVPVPPGGMRHIPFVAAEAALAALLTQAAAA
ncbi:glycosyl transferase family 2 [Nostoc sp. 3335mG]|nr:glycosyl transferase family 2 [Nostoc sp. 3335mG]